MFDVIVVGIGHAGAEAALVARRLGASVVALTQDPTRACLMSCNPAIGGPGKSQLVREIDALGGGIGKAADRAATQARLLNRTRGPASYATRLQVDRRRYALEMQALLSEAEVRIVKAEVVGIEVVHGEIRGVCTADGQVLVAKSIVLTTGTFLAARMHVGADQTVGGRAGDRSSEDLALSLRSLGLKLGRFKTGTPPRLDGRTIDFSKCEEQPSEAGLRPFATSTNRDRFPALRQRSAFQTRTNVRTHAIVAAALPDSPLTSGVIVGRGPRYCPSLEQKILSYPGRASHLVFLESEGLDTSEVYPAGLSTSLPVEAQLALLRTILGLEQVEITRAGYAVEYDYLVYGQLTQALEVRGIRGLFCAGQINGSSGYEEAAGQGLVAGINAVRGVRNQPHWVPRRSESYLGVLCDDLVTKGFDEPYRLLPSRSEDRLHLREDNAAFRLLDEAASLGVRASAALAPLTAARVAAMARDGAMSSNDLRWLRVPTRTLLEATVGEGCLAGLPPEGAEVLFHDLRYRPYEAQRGVEAGRLLAMEELVIPGDLDLELVVGFSAEVRDAFRHKRPCTLSEAAALPGVGRDAIAVLAAHLRRRARLTSVPRGTRTGR